MVVIELLGPWVYIFKIHWHRRDKLLGHMLPLGMPFIEFARIFPYDAGNLINNVLVHALIG